MKRPILVCSLVVAPLVFGAATARAMDRPLTLAAASSSAIDQQQDKKLSPEEKMARRFPQPIRAGDLVGLAVLDWRDSTIGYVQQVVRTPIGKIQLIVPYRRRFGWLSHRGILGWGTRPVAVPLETVAMLGRQVAALDMSREDFDAAPTFSITETSRLDPDETFPIALTKR